MGKGDHAEAESGVVNHEQQHQLRPSNYEDYYNEALKNARWRLKKAKMIADELRSQTEGCSPSTKRRRGSLWPTMPCICGPKGARRNADTGMGSLRPAVT